MRELRDRIAFWHATYFARLPRAYSSGTESCAGAIERRHLVPVAVEQRARRLEQHLHLRECALHLRRRAACCGQARSRAPTPSPPSRCRATRRRSRHVERHTVESRRRHRGARRDRRGRRLARHDDPVEQRGRSTASARMPSVSHVRTISRPRRIDRDPVEEHHVRAERGMLERAQGREVRRDVGLGEEDLAPVEAEAPSTGVAVVAQSSSAPPKPASDVHEASTISPVTTPRRKRSARSSGASPESPERRTVVRCICTASAVAPPPCASRSCASRNSRTSAFLPPSSAGTVSAR